MASATLPASATTCTSSVCVNKVRSPTRTTSWSSTSITLIFPLVTTSSRLADGHHDPCPPVRCGGDFRDSPELPRTCCDVTQAQPELVSFTPNEPSAVVADFKPHPARKLAQGDHTRPCIGVPYCVTYGFTRDLQNMVGLLRRELSRSFRG